jgi:hypothetical protein
MAPSFRVHARLFVPAFVGAGALHAVAVARQVFFLGVPQP